MKLAVAAALSLVLVSAAGAAPTADECDGLDSCIPVAGPWVAVPARVGAGLWQLKCPVGVVAGLDARVSERPLHVTFDGFLGSPVNPGITTAKDVLFTGRWAGALRKTVSFKPYIGCIRGGGGQRTPTGRQQLRPERPVTIRSVERPVVAGQTARATLQCARHERMLSASHAVGVYAAKPPAASLFEGVRVTRMVREGIVSATASRDGLPSGPRIRVQLQAVCTR